VILLSRNIDLLYTEYLVENYSENKEKKLALLLTAMEETLLLNVNESTIEVCPCPLFSLSFVITVAKIVMDGLSRHSRTAARKRVLTLLENVCSSFPSFVDGRLLQCKLLIQLGLVPAAAKELMECETIYTTSSEMYLVLAQLAMVKGDTVVLLQHLERALSIDFSIRNHPLYKMLKGYALIGEVSMLFSKDDSS